MSDVPSVRHKKKKKFFNFFPTPQYLHIATVGVSITDRAVQAVEFRTSGEHGKIVLHRASEILLPPSAITSGYINNKDAVTTALKELRKKYDFTYARATLPEEKSYIFTVDMEKDPFESLRDRVAFTIEENAPVSLAKSTFDFELIGSVKGKTEIKLAVSVVPVKEVEIYIEVFEAAGITPISFDIESQAVARAVIEHGDSRATLIANVDQEKTGLYVVEDEVVQFSSTTPFGVRKLNEVYPDLVNLKNEIRKTIVFWNTRLTRESIPGKKIERMIITGKGAIDDDFVSEILSGTGIEGGLANVWTNAFSLDEYLPPISFKESFEYTAAIGVALPHREPRYV